MKVKHLGERQDELADGLAAEAPEDFPSRLAIGEIAGLARIFSLLAQIRLKDPEPLGVDDEWMLDAFRAAQLHSQFDEAFRRICETDHDDFGRLYLRAYAFFFRAGDPGEDIAGLLARLRGIVDRMVSNRTAEAILDRLREARVIVDSPDPTRD